MLKRCSCIFLIAMFYAFHKTDGFCRLTTTKLPCDVRNIKHLRFSDRDDMNTKNLTLESSTTNVALMTVIGSSVLFMGSNIASAIAEPSAREALQLLSGYQTRTPNFFTWGTLAVLAYVLAFEVWKKILAAW